MDWETKLEALRAWAEAASGLPAEWRDDRQPMQTGSHILLHVSSMEEKHHPATDHEYVAAQPNGSQIIPRQWSMNRVTVELACRGWHGDGGGAGLHAALALRSRLRLSGPGEGWGLIDAGPLVTVPFEHAGRRWSQHTFDVDFNVRAIFHDTDNPTTWIETVNRAHDTRPA